MHELNTFSLLPIAFNNKKFENSLIPPNTGDVQDFTFFEHGNNLRFVKKKQILKTYFSIRRINARYTITNTNGNAFVIPLPLLVQIGNYWTALISALVHYSLMKMIAQCCRTYLCGHHSSKILLIAIISIDTFAMHK